MYFYQVQKHHQRIIINDYIKDENYVCSLTMKASVVLAIIQSMNDSQRRTVIDLSKPEIVKLVKHLEKYIKNHSCYKMINHNYKTLLTQEDFDVGLVELIAVCHFLLEDSSQETNKIQFIQTSVLEWREYI